MIVICSDKSRVEAVSCVVQVVQVPQGAPQHPQMVGWNIPAGWGIPPQYYYPQQKRPEENYWDTRLTDNGLKLEGMHIRCVGRVVRRGRVC